LNPNGITYKKKLHENLFSVGVFICMSGQPVAGTGMDEVNPNGITKGKEASMIEVHSQIIETSFIFVVRLVHLIEIFHSLLG